MLRKKLKLDDKPEEKHSSEFALKSFNAESKPQLCLSNPDGCKQPPMLPATESALLQPPLWQKVYQLELQLCEALKQVTLPADVAVTYNPIEYAAELHTAYMQKYLDNPKPVLFLGMNPGPWGMCQTGVPFGYVPAVRDWMQLRGQILKPIPELHSRPVDGLSCTRAEQSGQRWWGLYQILCGEPEKFFKNCFVYNICPLAFFHATGRNITPADLKGPSKNRLQEVCVQYLKEALELFHPKIIISVGRYTEDRVKALVKQNFLDPSVFQLKCMPHPSPRSLNNTNWNEKAQVWLTENGLMPYLKP
ncbi:single-strand selective monofunctional uracil-DNA glycosylase [Wyeomyia smithii]|uniref:single-strand selective monofunctional uracil-DNA glycosylase n=1 Tax=Wyeomyia smithii TaxID=174621 RepID=UPI0024681FE6|nr:single-strand selective monofunctional uracil-DNA glycosylase [Wyeomyia smithii]XP_055543983.1 single-strand selective monofunctional uracil-DNA glycosylase [Wyeomyia smithii]XP_055543991.1 single-strand selective monofunctional uracil-DNA glycosylase [Wyeomyia smithii]